MDSKGQSIAIQFNFILYIVDLNWGMNMYKFKDRAGAKLNCSEYAGVVAGLMKKNVGDQQICKILFERYKYKTSHFTVAGFRANYFPHYQESDPNVEKIQTYIDESLAQINNIKKSILATEKEVEFLNERFKFTSKMEEQFEYTINSFIKDFDPNKPIQLPEHPKAMFYNKLRDALGGDFLVLKGYVETRNTKAIITLLNSLRDKILNSRISLVRIYKDVFKGYRNLSMMQEIMYIFKKYNEIIIDNFFPDTANMNNQLYEKVRDQIHLLFDELKLRYQVTDTPTETKTEELEEAKEELKTEVKKLTQSEEYKIDALFDEDVLNEPSQEPQNIQ